MVMTSVIVSSCRHGHLHHVMVFIMVIIVVSRHDLYHGHDHRGRGRHDLYHGHDHRGHHDRHDLHHGHDHRGHRSSWSLSWS